jgi:hypothetical protein
MYVTKCDDRHSIQCLSILYNGRGVRTHFQLVQIKTELEQVNNLAEHKMFIVKNVCAEALQSRTVYVCKTTITKS